MVCRSAVRSVECPGGEGVLHGKKLTRAHAVIFHPFDTTGKCDFRRFLKVAFRIVQEYSPRVTSGEYFPWEGRRYCDLSVLASHLARRQPQKLERDWPDTFGEGKD